MFPRSVLNKAAKVGTEILLGCPAYCDIVLDRFDELAGRVVKRLVAERRSRARNATAASN